jgi:hypothetical protein
MAKSNKITAAARVRDVLRLILAGAEFGDIRQFASDRGWNVCDRQIGRYVEKANAHFADAVVHDRNQMLGRHLMQRRALYARALKHNDIKVALMVLQDEAQLLGLYAPTKIAPTTPDGQEPFRLAVAQLTMEELRTLQRIQKSSLLTHSAGEVIDEPTHNGQHRDD